MKTNPILALVTAVCMMLSACATPGGQGGMDLAGLNNINVGPTLSSFGIVDAPEIDNLPKLDVIIPVFDPGLLPNSNGHKAKGIWPELRRAEANRFALKLKDALEATGKFGAVRVTPDAKATGDLYLLGTIKQSSGQDVEIELKATDISGARWFTQSFDHSVKEEFFDNARNRGKDAYDPVFVEAAEYIVNRLKWKKVKELKDLQALTEVRFAANFSQDGFAQYLKTNGTIVTLAGLPDRNDPMVVRTNAIRIRDQLYIDGLQNHYLAFNSKMTESYSQWQRQTFLEAKAASSAQTKAIGKGLLGALAIGLAVAAGSQDTGNLGVAYVGAKVGVELIREGFRTSDEAKVHRDALAELGKSIDIELSPQVIAFEEKTVKLTGDAAEQFSQWRQFLKKIYLTEVTPDVQL
jgi:hypothetical protein